MQTLPQVFYPDSPFMPDLSYISLHSIKMLVNSGEHPAVAISRVLLADGANSSGTMIDINHNDELKFGDLVNPLYKDSLFFDFVKNNFNVTVDDMDYWFLGFITAPTMIFGVSLVHSFGIKKAVSIVCKPGEDAKGMKYGYYKTIHLPRAYKIFIPAISDPMLIASEIYSDCRSDDSFTDNIWFFVGMESSERLFYRYWRKLLSQGLNTGDLHE